MNRRERSSSCSPEHRSANAQNTPTNTRNSSSATFKVGVISLAFLVMGYQICLFVHRTATLRIEANMDAPDTVYVQVLPKPEPAAAGAGAASVGPSAEAQTPKTAVKVVRRAEADHSPAVRKVRAQSLKRHTESFRFNPNEATEEEFVRLGFSEKQAQSIINYRLKGGRFRRPSDFAKSYVVADSVFRRLEPFIDIPKVDINTADSAAFDALPGIGPWFASKMVEYRESLGGYGSTEQLMDIWHFDREKYDAIGDLIVCLNPAQTLLWTMSEDSLRAHPAIRNYRTAHSIALYRQTMPKEKWTLDELMAAGILTEEQYTRLGRCLIAPICADDAQE